MNILIVDDNANNRMILRLLLEDYAEENDSVTFEIDEAADGLEAVEKCKDSSFDMVLMDIMMPNMDGIEATKILREYDKNMMIIAVSAVDDSVRQRMILNNGAEDYISKPVNSDIFTSRISNYITLINARKHTLSSVKSNKHNINLFTDNIYNRYTSFTIDCEDSVSEFWEFFLLNAEVKYNGLSDIIRTLVTLTEAHHKLSIESYIYVEESDTYQYFTLNQIDKLPRKVIELIIKKNKIMCEYKISDDKISFELLKECTAKECVNNQEEKTVKPTIVKEVTVVDEVSESDVNMVSKELVVFNYLDEYDSYDLEEYVTKLSSLMLIVSSGDITEEEIEEIYTYLEKIGSILTTYNEVYPISKALTMLAFEMANHVDTFAKNSEALGPMCKAFSSDMSSWFKMSFHTGAPSADFMNDTISVNCETIAGMLRMDENGDSSEEELDDIFDF